MKMTIRVKSYERAGKFHARLTHCEGGKPQIFCFQTAADLEAALLRAVGAVTQMFLNGEIKRYEVKRSHD